MRFYFFLSMFFMYLCVMFYIDKYFDSWLVDNDIQDDLFYVVVFNIRMC